MGLTNEIARYGRMSAAMFKLARTPALGDYANVIRRGVENRETNFLALVRHAVYANPASPYRRMFELAQCGYEDLEQAVRRGGIGPILTTLADAGVYLTQDEAKGRTPIVRAGEIIPSGERSFLNPGLAAHIESESSGSRGKPTRTPQNLASQLRVECYNAVMADDLKLGERRVVMMSPILPSAAGVAMAVRAERFGWHVERWYAVGTILDSGHYRALTRAMVLGCKLAGSHAPFPRYLPDNDFSPG